MPRKASGTFDQKAYINEYINTKIVYKSVNFNVGKPEDMELLAWIDAQEEKVSPYIKRLIRADMEAHKKEEG